jgi:hypothetical protein
MRNLFFAVMCTLVACGLENIDSDKEGGGQQDGGGVVGGTFRIAYWGVQNHDTMSLWAIAYDATGAAVCSSWGNGKPIAVSSGVSRVEGNFQCDKPFTKLKLNAERVDNGKFTYAFSNVGGSGCVPGATGTPCTCGQFGQFQLDGVNIETNSLGWSTNTGFTKPAEGCDGWYVP